MPVSDDVVATVRAYLQADKEQFQELNAALDRSREASAAYRAMIIAAFYVAVRRKFTEQSSQDEIVEYVAKVRSRGEDLPDVLDPTAAERMITSVFTDESTRDIDSRTKMAVQMFFATAIVNDEGIQGQALDEFLARARRFADDLLG